MSTCHENDPYCMWVKFKPINFPIESHISRKYNRTKQSHLHDYAQLFYCTEGELIHTVDGTDYHCSEGSLIIVPPGKKHGYKTIGDIPATHIQTNIAFNFFENYQGREELSAIAFIFLYEFCKELKFEGKLKIDFRGNEKLISDNVFSELSRYEWKNRTSANNHITNLFEILFGLPAFHISDKSAANISAFIKSKYIPILKSLYYMNINYFKKIKAEDLASQSNMCRTDFFRYFKRFFGTTYNHYLSAIRVSHAMTLCKFSRYSFDYIANICGFSDHSHMDVQFKKHYLRKPPGALRRERGTYITEYPHMIQSREEYNELPDFFYSYNE